MRNPIYFLILYLETPLLKKKMNFFFPSTPPNADYMATLRSKKERGGSITHGLVHSDALCSEEKAHHRSLALLRRDEQWCETVGVG